MQQLTSMCHNIHDRSWETSALQLVMSVSCQRANNVKLKANLSNNTQTLVDWKGQKGIILLDRLAAYIAPILHKVLY